MPITRLFADARPAAPDLGPLFAAIREAVVVVHGAEERIVRWNPAAEALLGYTAAEAIGRSLELVLAPEAASGACLGLCTTLHGRAACARGEAPLRTAEATRKDGRRLVIEGSSSSYLAPDGQRYAILVLRDVSDRKRLEAQLAAAEQIAGLGSFDYELTTNACTNSPGLLAIYGLDPDQPSHDGARRYDLIHPDDQALVTRQWHATLEGCDPPVTSYRIVRPDGALRHVRASARLVKGTDGRPLRLVGTLTDVTEAVEDRERLAASEASYRLLADNIGDIVVVADLAGLISYVSPSVEAVLGRAPAGFLGRPMGELFPSEGGGRPGEPIGSTVRHADGRLLWLEAMARPLRDAAGAPVGMIACLRDVSARRRAEALLALQNDVLQAIAEAAPLETVLTSLASGVAWFCGTNRAMVMLRGADDHGVPVAAPGVPAGYLEAIARGVPAKPLPGEPWSPRRIIVDDVAMSDLPAYVRGAAHDHHVEAMWIEPVLDAQDRVVAKLGLLFPQAVVLEPWHAQILATAADLAGIAIARAQERELVARQTAALEAANQRLVRTDQQKDEFLSVISHELRNPLNIVMGYLNLLRSGAGGHLEAQQLHFVDAVMRGADTMHRLVDDLLDMARVRTGTLAVHPRPTDLTLLADEVMAAMAPKAADKGLKLACEVPAGLVLPADETRVGQVLSNLIGNAVKFTPRGGRIDVTAAAEPGLVRFTVRDDGPGIDVPAQALLFERFQQIDTGLGRCAEGLGLGLSICKAIVEAHGGRIGVDSAPGAGSTFWFTLPERAA